MTFCTMTVMLKSMRLKLDANPRLSILLVL